jgi:HAD superfamily phosphoserine phosphatase-like hydrolase
MMPDCVVIWDIDGTIISESLERRLLAFLRRKKLVSDKQLSANAWRLLWQWPPPAWYRLKLAYLRGVDVRTANDWMQQCWLAEIKPHLWPGAVAAIAELKSSGVRQVLLSGTIRPLAELLAAHLGIEELIAAEPEVDNGTYTGRLLAPVASGERKQAVAESWLSENNLVWQHAVAVGNHWGDRFLLQQARRAAVVKPDQQLRRQAEQSGWFVIDRPESPPAFQPLLDAVRELT